jgi:hypothetical protein
MVAGEASDLYASNTYTWLATSSALGANDEPAVNNHSPFHPLYSLGVYPECVISVHRYNAFMMFYDWCLCLSGVSCRSVICLVYNLILVI